jgi:hypothetical protein
MSPFVRYSLSKGVMACNEDPTLNYLILLALLEQFVQTNKLDEKLADRVAKPYVTISQEQRPMQQFVNIEIMASMLILLFCRLYQSQRIAWQSHV